MEPREIVARIVDADVFRQIDNQAGFPPESIERSQNRRVTEAFAKADAILTALEGVLQPLTRADCPQMGRATPGVLDWVLVPREPTEAMIDAYFDRCRALGFVAHINASAAWETLLAAAPSTQTEDAQPYQKDGL